MQAGAYGPGAGAEAVRRGGGLDERRRRRVPVVARGGEHPEPQVDGPADVAPGERDDPLARVGRQLVLRAGDEPRVSRERGRLGQEPEPQRQVRPGVRGGAVRVFGDQPERGRRVTLLHRGDRLQQPGAGVSGAAQSAQHLLGLGEVPPEQVQRPVQVVPHEAERRTVAALQGERVVLQRGGRLREPALEGGDQAGVDGCPQCEPGQFGQLGQPGERPVLVEKGRITQLQERNPAHGRRVQLHVLVAGAPPDDGQFLSLIHISWASRSSESPSCPSLPVIPRCASPRRSFVDASWSLRNPSR